MSNFVQAVLDKAPRASTDEYSIEDGFERLKSWIELHATKTNPKVMAILCNIIYHGPSHYNMPQPAWNEVMAKLGTIIDKDQSTLAAKITWLDKNL